ncbi:hypothetical protein [Planktothricoides raciborskii]|uniref:Uncharacterized protein n=1 Tax=Planktothricoides raciborskii GIHE-MW2 TaxID=2792601 RepID=A0AAU8JH61_9CYAN
MPKFQPDSQPEMTANAAEMFKQLNIASESLIACITVPMLLGLVGGKAIADGLQSLGQASEEIFRGDRLPVLHFPVAADANPEQ